MLKKLKEQKGITLIALIITMIVMLILVVVTIRIATDGKLFDYAKQARDLTENQIAREQTILNGIVEGQSIEDWVQGKMPPVHVTGITISKSEGAPDELKVGDTMQLVANILPV